MKNRIITKVMAVMMASAICLGLYSCKEDEEGLLGSDNRRDVAITSNVGEIGITYAEIYGFVNLDYVIPSGNYQIGVELSEFEDFDFSINVTATELDGNRLTVRPTNLSGNTRYYYRTYVQLIGGVKYLGEKKRFNTKKFINVTNTSGASDIKYTSAVINCIADTLGIDKENKYTIGVAYTDKKEYMNPDSLFLRDAKGKYRLNPDNKPIPGFGGVIVPFDSIKNDRYKAHIAGLKPGRTYYYASFTAAGNRLMFGEVKEFTTQALTDELFSATEASSILITSATLEATTNLSSVFNSNEAITYSIRYAESADSLDIKKAYKSICVTKNGNVLSGTATGLADGKTYYYCAAAYLQSTKEYMLSTPKSFTTRSGAEFIQPGEVYDIEAFDAKVMVQSTLTSLYGNDARIEYSIEYSAKPDAFKKEMANQWVARLNNGQYISNLEYLSPATTYYYRTMAYIGSIGEYVYSSISTFTTGPIEVGTSGAVDLGLTSNTKWAACNLGASAPEDFGKYFAWAETSDKTVYSYANYVGKDTTDISGTRYDAAKAILGDEWRMPTEDELKELCNECDWHEAVYKNTSGYVVIGPNRNAIFLPMAGYKNNTTYISGGCYYWTGHRAYLGGTNSTCGAVSLIEPWRSSSSPGYNGYTIRPVQ